MSDQFADSIRRREFLQTGAVAGVAAAATVGASSPAWAQEKAEKTVLPKRTLGRTGVDVTILNHGTFRAPGGLDRLLRYAYSQGVRYFDTARSYGTEPGFKRWFQAMPEVRKEIFLVTKDNPGTPRDLLQKVDQRLEALGTDYIDLLFIHGLGDHGIEREVEWPRSKEFKETAEAIRKTGKVKFVGFSTHHAQRAQILQNAAEGGFVDAIMVQYTPWLAKDDALNKALDACHEKGIGLISMKQLGGQFLNQVYQRAPVLKEKGLNPYQGLLHAVWTDERVASSCISMRTLDQIKENVEAARRFEPLTQAQIHQIRDAALAHGPIMCADCDGRCARAAGTTAALGDLTRYLMYYEHHGIRSEARRLYSELPQELREWAGADLEAATKACPNRLNFARLMPQIDRCLG